MREKMIPMALVLGVMFLASGCVRHVHHHPPVTPRGAAHRAVDRHIEKQVEKEVEKQVDEKYSDKDLEHQHNDKTVVIVHHKKHLRGRHCWPHGAHWHCR